MSKQELEAQHDALLLAGGSEHPFDFFASSAGRTLDGLHFAMSFLPQQNRRVSGEAPGSEPPITAKDKHVIVIGGGDTGSDCIGTSFRQGAKSVTQLEIMPQPPEKENKALSWLHWPLKLRVSSSQAEGAKVEYAIATTGFAGANGRAEVVALYAGRWRRRQPRQRRRAARGPVCWRWALLARWKAMPSKSWPAVVARGRFKGLMPMNATSH